MLHAVFCLHQLPNRADAVRCLLAATVADYKRGLRMLGGAFPAKVKAIRILHLNRAISIALSIAMPLLSAKMRARQVHREACRCGIRPSVQTLAFVYADAAWSGPSRSACILFQLRM